MFPGFTCYLAGYVATINFTLVSKVIFFRLFLSQPKSWQPNEKWKRGQPEI